MLEACQHLGAIWGTMRKNAFTLIEILTVVVILGILAAIVMPSFLTPVSEAQVSSARGQLQTIRSQIELFRSKNGDLPPVAGANGVDGLWDALILNPPDGSSYLDRIPRLPSDYALIWDGTELRMRYDGLDTTLALEVPTW